MHINQQQNFEYSIICRLQKLLPKSTHCHYTDWNIKYLPIYIYSCNEVFISLAGSRAMIRARASAKKHMCAHYLICTSCMLDWCPFNNLQYCHTLCTYFIDTDELWFMLIDPQALIWFWETTMTALSYLP